MSLLHHLFSLFCAYMLGSIPTAVWIGQAFYGVDVREYGSGNAGATNTFRVLGKRAGIPVLIIDILKGWLSVNLAYIFSDFQHGSNEFINLQLALALAALIGHIFPVFAGFRGGKGVATLLGIGIAIHPPAAGICLSLFIVMLVFSKYVSLSSIAAGITFPVLVLFVFNNKAPSLNVFAIGVAVMILVTHQKNIERLLRGEESKVKLFKRKMP